MDRPDDKVLFGFKRWVFFRRRECEEGRVVEEKEDEDKKKN